MQNGKKAEQGTYRRFGHQAGQDQRCSQSGVELAGSNLHQIIDEVAFAKQHRP